MVKNDQQGGVKRQYIQYGMSRKQGQEQKKDKTSVLKEQTKKRSNEKSQGNEMFRKRWK